MYIDKLMTDLLSKSNFNKHPCVINNHVTISVRSKIQNGSEITTDYGKSKINKK